MYYWQFKNGKLSEPFDWTVAINLKYHSVFGGVKHYAAWDRQLVAYVLYAA